MIRLLEQDKIDQDRWDRVVAESCFPSVYGLSWYLNLVSPGWMAMVVDDYAALFPLPVKKKFGIRYMAQPPFTQQLGVFSKDPVDDTLMRTLILHAQRRFPFADLQLNETNRIRKNGFNVYPRRNIVLPLDLRYAELREAYHGQVRRNLGRFRGSGLSVVRDDTAFTLVIDTFRKRQGKRYRGMKKRDYEVLEQLCRECLSRQILDVRIVRNTLGHLIAGAIFLHSFNRYIFLFSANSTEGYTHSAMSAVVDSFIRDHAPGPVALDFEGSDDVGLARFYRSFGSKDTTYLRVVYNKLKWPIRMLKYK